METMTFESAPDGVLIVGTGKNKKLLIKYNGFGLFEPLKSEVLDGSVTLVANTLLNELKDADQRGLLDLNTEFALSLIKKLRLQFLENRKRN